MLVDTIVCSSLHSGLNETVVLVKINPTCSKPSSKSSNHRAVWQLLQSASRRQHGWFSCAFVACINEVSTV